MHPVENVFQNKEVEDHTYTFSDHPVYDEYGYDLGFKGEHDLFSSISSSNFVLQQEDFKNYDIKIDNHDILDAFGINPNVSYSDDYGT